METRNKKGGKQKPFLWLAIWFIVAPTTSLFAQKITPKEYIEKYKDAAISMMEEHGCPASIILAIAMHESANGNSKVANHLNNHFGIKGRNNSKTIRSAYKGYPSVEESYSDFIQYLKRRKTTSQLFAKYTSDDHQNWVRGIARAGYAQSPSWSSKVLATISRYELHALDEGPGGVEAVALVAESASVDPPSIYIVEKGDTLSAIARRFNSSVKEIQLKNEMRSTRLRIGQQLVL